MVNTVNALAEAVPSPNTKPQTSMDGSSDAFQKHLEAAKSQSTDNTNKFSVKKASRMKQIDQGWESLKKQESGKDDTTDMDDDDIAAAKAAGNPAMQMAQGIINVLQAFGVLGGNMDKNALLNEISQLLGNVKPQGNTADGAPGTALPLTNEGNTEGNTKQVAADITALLQAMQSQGTNADAATLANLQAAVAPSTSNANILPGYLKKALEKVIQGYADSATKAADANADSDKAATGNDLIQLMLMAAMKGKGDTDKQSSQTSQSRFQAVSQNQAKTGAVDADAKTESKPESKTQAGTDASKIVANTETAKQSGPIDTPKGMAFEGLKGTAKETQENISRIIDKMQSSITDGKQEFTIQLKPEYLGRLTIKLVMGGDGISAHIKTSDMGAHGLLSDQLGSLQQALKDKGINLVNMDVKYDATAFDLSGFQNSQQNPNWNGGKKNFHYATARDLSTGSLTYDAMTEDPRLPAYNHSVEFKA